MGVVWNIEKDVFQFEVFKPDKPATKRGILSAISSLYDPMGFVCPVVLKAKRIMQRLWKLQLAWDDPVPECELAHWERWKSELCALTQVQIPRCHFQLHGRKSLFTSSQTRQMRVMACAPICGSSMKMVLFSAPF